VSRHNCTLSHSTRGYKHDGESQDPSQRQVLDSRAKRRETGHPLQTGGQRLDLPQQEGPEASVPHAGEPVH